MTLTPEELAYLAGRGSIERDRQNESDVWADRIVSAAQRPADIFSAITDGAWENGDRAVFDQRGNVHLQFGDEGDR
jgi:hypothetical protein